MFAVSGDAPVDVGLIAYGDASGLGSDCGVTEAVWNEEVGVSVEDWKTDFEGFFLSSLDLMTIAGADGYLRVVNPAWHTLLGWTAEELCSEPFMTFIHPDDAEATAAVVAKSVSGQATVAFENRYRHRDGSYVVVEWNAWPENDMIYALGRDNTGRRELEASLLESEAMSRSVLETAFAGIITIDGEGTIEGFNPSAERIFGYSASDVMGCNVKMLMPEPYHGEHDGYLARYLETGERRIIGIGREVEGRRKDGTRFPLELAVSEVQLGTRRLFTGIVRDITERHAALAAIDEALAAADQASQAKTDFLSRMSHELRTPLNSILGFAQLMAADATTADQQEAAAMIISAGRHLLELINEVLDISRIEAGYLSLSPEAVHLGEVLHECLALIGPEAQSRQVELVDRDGAGLYVRADRQRLKQVALNLLSNAVKYTPELGRVTLEATATEEGRIRVSISDNGPGIHPDAVGRLFQPFQRLDAESSGIEGTGLGLVLSARLVKAMGGTIGVDSTVREGSTFWFELAVADAPPMIEEPQDADATTAVTAPRVAGTVLYIEDNLANLRLVERIIRRRPALTLLTAVKGRTGLHLAAEHQPDLILLDLNLPDLPGHQVLARLRSNPATSGIPVAVISADATPGQVRRLLEAGALDFLTKPIDLKQILNLFDRVIN